MTRTTRRQIFYALLALFFILGAVIVFYADGWRFDFQAWRFEKIGGIYVRSFPENATIAINNKAIGNSSGFLSPGTLVSDLLPKAYSVVLKAPGYDDWHEDAEVSPEFVVQFKYAVLVPSQGIVAASGTIENFSLIGGNALTQATSQVIMFGEKRIAKGNLVSGNSNPGDFIFQNTANENYYLYDLNTATTSNLSSAFLAQGFNLRNASSVSLDPYGSNTVIASNENRIWLLGIEPATVTTIEKTSQDITIAPPIATSPSMIAWMQFSQTSDTSAIVTYDKLSGAITTSSAALEGTTIQLTWLNGSTFGVLQSDSSLYRCDTHAQTCNKLADDVTSFAATADGSGIAALEQKSFEVFLSNGGQNYYRFNLPNIADALRAIWYHDDTHLFIVYPDHVSFLDLADASLVNFTTVANGTSPAYDASTNALYIIDPSGQLIRYDFPD